MYFESLKPARLNFSIIDVLDQTLTTAFYEAYWVPVIVTFLGILLFNEELKKNSVPFLTWIRTECVKLTRK